MAERAFDLTTDNHVFTVGNQLSAPTTIVFETSFQTTRNYTFYNSGRTYILYSHEATTSQTITVETPQKIEGLDIGEYTYTSTAIEIKLLGPFKPSVFNDASGRASFTISTTTNAEIAVLNF